MWQPLRRFDDPAIHAIADKVDAVADTELDKVPLRPMSMPSIVTLTTRAGKQFSTISRISAKR